MELPLDSSASVKKNTPLLDITEKPPATPRTSDLKNPQAKAPLKTRRSLNKPGHAVGTAAQTAGLPTTEKRVLGRRTGCGHYRCSSTDQRAMDTPRDSATVQQVLLQHKRSTRSWALLPHQQCIHAGLRSFNLVSLAMPSQNKD